VSSRPQTFVCCVRMFVTNLTLHDLLPSRMPQCVDGSIVQVLSRTDKEGHV
jgi:hypothetical protein